jgi:hypothetical protein
MNVEDMIINEDVIGAERAFDKATVDDLVDLCRKYLAALGVYRDRLFDLRGIPEIDLKNSTPDGRAAVEKTREMVRNALASTSEKRNRIEALLNSFTSISGYDAANTFNQFKYKGFDSWEPYSGGTRLKYVYSDRGLNMQETIETASLLRREAYLESKTTVLR